MNIKIKKPGILDWMLHLFGSKRRPVITPDIYKKHSPYVYITAKRERLWKTVLKMLRSAIVLVCMLVPEAYAIGCGRFTAEIGQLLNKPEYRLSFAETLLLSFPDSVLTKKRSAYCTELIEIFEETACILISHRLHSMPFGNV